MSKPELLEPSEGEGFHQRENPEHIWNLRMGAACTSLCVSWGSWLGLLTALWLTFWHILFGMNMGEYFSSNVWADIKHLTNLCHLSKRLKTMQIQLEVSAAWLGRLAPALKSVHEHGFQWHIFILALLWNEVSEDIIIVSLCDTITSQRTLWRRTSAQQGRGSVNGMIVTFVLVVNKPGRNSWPPQGGTRVACSLWASKWWKTTWHWVHQLVCIRTSDGDRNQDVLGRDTEWAVGRRGVHLPYL